MSWVIIGRFKDGERILGTAEKIFEVSPKLQTLHLKHLGEIEEIWYQSQTSWRERANP